MVTGATETSSPTQASGQRTWLRSTVVMLAVLALAATGLSVFSAWGSPAAATPAASPKTCQPPMNWRATTAAPVPGVTSDFDLTSFDGTKIRIHWFPDPSGAGSAEPTALMGPGWGESGDTDTSQAGIQG